MEVASPALKAYLLLKLLNGLRRGDLLRLSLESLPANGIHVRMSKTGACYVSLQKTASGFDSLWRRFMSKVLRGTSIRERFQEKDLRKKTASDMTLQSASRCLDMRRPKPHAAIIGSVENVLTRTLCPILLWRFQSSMRLVADPLAGDGLVGTLKKTK